MGGGLALHYLRVQNSGMYSQLKGIFSLGSYLMKISLVYTQPLNNNIPVLMLHGKSRYYIYTNWYFSMQSYIYYHKAVYRILYIIIY